MKLIDSNAVWCFWITVLTVIFVLAPDFGKHNDAYVVGWYHVLNGTWLMFFIAYGIFHFFDQLKAHITRFMQRECRRGG